MRLAPDNPGPKGKYNLLCEGTIMEKRELLACMRSRLIIKNKVLILKNE